MHRMVFLLHAIILQIKNRRGQIQKQNVDDEICFGWFGGSQRVGKQALSSRTDNNSCTVLVVRKFEPLSYLEMIFVLILFKFSIIAHQLK